MRYRRASQTVWHRPARAAHCVSRPVSGLASGSFPLRPHLPVLAAQWSIAVPGSLTVAWAAPALHSCGECAPTSRFTPVAPQAPQGHLRQTELYAAVFRPASRQAPAGSLPRSSGRESEHVPKRFGKHLLRSSEPRKILARRMRRGALCMFAISPANLGLTLLSVGLAAWAPTATAAEGASRSGPVESYASVPGGEFRSVLPEGAAGAASHIESFALQRIPVTNGDYLDFVRTHPEWQRGQVPATLADTRYLQHWYRPLEPGPQAGADQPVTHVSWFAARAYCESRQARLPTWIEWEIAAAADEHVADARHDPVWRQTILAALGRSPGAPLPAVGLKPRNLYGIHDLHGVVWEWVEDFDTLFTPRGHSEHEHAGMAMSPGDTAMSCGAAALSVSDPENYPMILRLAVLSSLNRNSITADLGFRCARSIGSPAAPATPIRRSSSSSAPTRAAGPASR